MTVTQNNVPVPPPLSGQMPFTVTGIGSCRVAGPLRKAEKKGDFALNQTGIYGYCHSAPEAVQQLQYLKRAKRPPAHLMPVVAPSLSVSAPPQTHVASDLYVIEICSSKELVIDGYFVQLNYLTKHLSTFFEHHQTAKEFWRLTRLGLSAERRSFLKSVSSFGDLGDAEQHMLMSLQFSETTQHKLRQAIDNIQSMTGDQLFITHFNALKHDGAHIRSRKAFVEMVAGELRDSGVQFFNPSDYIEVIGQDRALAEGGTSLSHYSADFEEFLGQNWLTRYIDPRQKRKVAKPGSAASPSGLPRPAVLQRPEQVMAATG